MTCLLFLGHSTPLSEACLGPDVDIMAVSPSPGLGWLLGCSVIGKAHKN